MGAFDNWKARPHCLYRIMTGAEGMTPVQVRNLEKLEQREIEAKDGLQDPLTENMEATLKVLREKRDKKPELTEGVKNFLLEEYVWHKYGIRKDVYSVYLEKGLLSEEDTISLLSLIDDRLYTKNETRKESEYLSGCPDWGVDHPNIDEATIVDDAKSSWDMLTFMASKLGNLTTQYEWQGLGYMQIWPNIQEWRVRHGLVNTPQILLEQLKGKIRYKLGIIDEFGPESRELIAYRNAAEQIDKLGNYDHIPPKERTATKVVKRDDEKIALIGPRVIECRTYLNWLDDFHVNG